MKNPMVGVTYRRARKRYRCDESPWAGCSGYIERGETYERSVAFPGHDFAGDWWVHRRCSRCMPEEVRRG